MWCGATALFLLNRLGFVLLFGSFFVELIVDENALDKNSHGRGGKETGGEVAFAMPAPKAWDARFYQSAPTRGEAVYLAVKTGARSTWVVLRPDRSLGFSTRPSGPSSTGPLRGRKASTGLLEPC